MTVEELPDDMAPADGTGVELVCEECGHTFEHTGRGRRPKRGPCCRTARSTRSTSPEEETAPRRPRGIDQLQRNLHQQLVMFGVGLSFLDSFDGAHIVKKAEKGSKVLSNLAATNPKVRKALETGAEMAGWGPVLLFGAELFIPIAAHHGFIRGVKDPAKKDDPGGMDVSI